jgi:hypothetical protein
VLTNYTTGQFQSLFQLKTQITRPAVKREAKVKSILVISKYKLKKGTGD